MNKRKPVPIGKKFGKLTIIENYTDEKGQTKVKCKCDCGKYKIVLLYELKNNHIKSCGCLRTKHGKSNKKNRLYKIWGIIRDRCFCKTYLRYKDYGGRGITICEEWKNDFLVFEKWALANGYSDNLSIDRINNDGNYCPENCRWATAKEQANNRRNSKFIYYNNEKLTISQFANKYNINRNILNQKINKGFKIQEIIDSLEEN